MHGKVDPELEFKGATVFARGPITWEGAPPDPVERMRLLEVTVTQGATNGTRSPDTDYDRPEEPWTCNVNARSGTWVAGPAQVVVRVRLWRDAVATSNFEEPWVETVRLVPA
jgi:hypothetical protein